MCEEEEEEEKVCCERLAIRCIHTLEVEIIVDIPALTMDKRLFCRRLHILSLRLLGKWSKSLLCSSFRICRMTNGIVLSGMVRFPMCIRALLLN